MSVLVGRLGAIASGLRAGMSELAVEEIAACFAVVCPAYSVTCARFCKGPACSLAGAESSVQMCAGVRSKPEIYILEMGVNV